MSDLRQPAGPDLHAIFGIDGAQENVADPVIAAHSSSAEMGLDGAPENSFETYSDVEEGLGATLEPAPEVEVELEQAGEQDWDVASDSAEPPAAPAGGPEPGWSGITRPSRRGSSSRFLTDVIVAMQLATARQVPHSMQAAKTTAMVPSGFSE